ncbi:pentatricopeptide repeat-containing protein [Sesbania bispinosa]|nr:pentatricopeptide repeat-containing protein [Sesbania bispinosa]
MTASTKTTIGSYHILPHRTPSPLRFGKSTRDGDQRCSGSIQERQRQTPLRSDTSTRNGDQTMQWFDPRTSTTASPSALAALWCGTRR